MTSNFRISKNLEDRSSNFPNFRKALFQFRILLWNVRKTIFRCLYFLGKVHIAFAIDSKFRSSYTLTRALSPRISSIQKNFTYAVIVKFENSKTAFRNFENSKSDLPNFGIFEKLEEDKWMEPIYQPIQYTQRYGQFGIFVSRSFFESP